MPVPRRSGRSRPAIPRRAPKTDAISIPTISELKVNFEGLNKVAYSLHYGCLRNPFWTSIIGGFAGGPEGCALVSVASAFNAILVYCVGGSGYVCNAGLLKTPAVNTARSTLWVRNVSMQALARNTNLICGGGGLTAAGPGTEQNLWEIAALGIHSATWEVTSFTATGKPSWSNPTRARAWRHGGKGKRPGRASITREDACEVINFILSKYEDSLPRKKHLRATALKDSMTMKT